MVSAFCSGRDEKPLLGYEFVYCSTSNGKSIRVLVATDEYCRGCWRYLALQVMHVLADLIMTNGRSDNIGGIRSKFVVFALKKRLATLSLQTQYIEPSSA